MEVTVYYSLAVVFILNSLGRRGQQLLQFLLVIFVKIVEIVDLIVVGLLFALGKLCVFADDLLDLLLECLDVLVVLFACSLEVADVLLHLIFSLLSHKSLAHSISDRTLVKRLIGLNCHLNLITNTHQKEAALCTVDSDLADKLIKTLGEEFLTEWTDTGLTGLSALELLVEPVLQINHINLSGGLGGNVTHPEATFMSELSWWQDRVEVVLITLLLVLPRLLKLIHGRLLLALGLLVGDAS